LVASRSVKRRRQPGQETTAKRFFAYYDFAEGLRLEERIGRGRSLSGRIPAIVFLGLVPILVLEIALVLPGWMKVDLEQPYYLHIALISLSICYFLTCDGIKYLGRNGASDDE
jgi:hypothetical protein